MSRSQTLTISPRDFHRLNNLSLACRGLESLLIMQDTELRGLLNPMQLAALAGVLAEGIEQAIDECGNAQITHRSSRKSQRKTWRV